MIAFLPMWILGVPLVLGLIDMMATRSGAGDVEYDAPQGRYVGTHRELRRGEEYSPVVGQPIAGQPVAGQPITRDGTPANIS